MNKVSYIIASKTSLKLVFEDGKSEKAHSYIDTLNMLYGFKLLPNKAVKVVPFDLIITEKDMDTIIYQLDKYFHSIIGRKVEFKKDFLDYNGNLCCGFDVYGMSEINLVSNAPEQP